MTDQNFFFQKWDREAPKFDAVMDALPPDRLDYRPHPKSRSAAEMVTHLAREQEMLVRMIDDGRIDYKDSRAEDFGEMRALWTKSTAELRDRLKTLDEAGWNRPVRFYRDGKQINETTTSENALGISPRHDSSPRPAIHLHPPDGRQSPVDLRAFRGCASGLAYWTALNGSSNPKLSTVTVAAAP